MSAKQVSMTVPRYEECWRGDLEKLGFGKVGFHKPTDYEIELYQSIPQLFNEYLKQLDPIGNLCKDLNKKCNGNLSYAGVYMYSNIVNSLVL